MSYRSIVGCISALVLLLLATEALAANWVHNGDFAITSGSGFAGWAHATRQPWKQEAVENGPAPTAVRTDIETARGGSLGEVRQTIKVRPNTKYRASVAVRSTHPDAALLMLKPRKDRKELDRLHVQGSGPEWRTLSLEFDSGQADEVQVLCRYSQRPEAVGTSVWFTNVMLEALDGSDPLSKPAPPAPAKPAFDPDAVVAAPALDQYITTEGAGDRSGRDWANARPADQLQAAIDAAGSGNTIFIGSGTYAEQSLVLKAGGSGPSALLTLAGHDTGGGLPVFRSTFDKANPARTGKTLLVINPGVSHVVVRDLRVEKHRQAIVLRGSNTNIAIHNVDVTETRDAFWIDGAAIAGDGGSGSRDIELRDCDVTLFTKRAVRIFNGVSNVRLTNCHADAGGREWATEPFAVGFHVIGGKDGVIDRNITFTDCTASNAWHDNGDKYWNADGYATERAVEDVTWIRCRAFNSTDGGWDLKNRRPKLIDCIGVGNKRNFRIWLNGTPGDGQNAAELTNCISAFTIDRGQRGHEADYWFRAGGEVIMKHCTAWAGAVSLVVETPDTAPATRVVLDHCLLSPRAGGQPTRLPEAIDLQVIASQLPTDPAAAPQPKAPTPTWRGGDDAFNLPDHPDLGYRHPTR